MSTMTEIFAADAAEVEKAAGPLQAAAVPLDEPWVAPMSASRHVLVVGDTGGMHLDHMEGFEFDHRQCRDIRLAFQTFAHNRAPVAEGFYWCSVAEDGTFELGGRLA